MRRLVRCDHHLLECWWLQRRCILDHQAFFELYGRSPDTDIIVNSQRSKGPSVVCAGASAAENFLPEKRTLPNWMHALEEFSVQLYSKPTEAVHYSVVGKTLGALEASVALPHDRRSQSYQNRWESALCVWNHTAKNDHCSAALLLTILYYSGKYDEVICHVEEYWAKLSSLHSLDKNNDLPHVMRVMSVYVLTSSSNGVSVSRTRMGKIKNLIESALGIMRHETVTEIAHEYKICMYVLDWYFHHMEDSQEQHFVSSLFLPLAPKSLQPCIFTTQSENGVNHKKKNLTPAILLRIGMEYARNGDRENLSSLFTVCKQRELSQNGFGLFLLSTRFGEMLSRMADVSTSTLLDVVGFCGTSLSFESLKKIGSTPRCRHAVLQILSRMKGPDPYFAARQILFHQNPAEALAFQEAKGDLLSGDSNLVWQTALQSMGDSIAEGNMKWRESLPTVLRLLSDAGKTLRFVQLLKEGYTEGEGASLMTASALGQIARRSGRWWYESDVLDMIVSSDLPQTRLDDLFLEDACLQTLYALRDAKRWKEALSFYTSLAPVVPKVAHGVVCSVVCGMPVSSPWEEALAAVQKFSNVPEKFLTTLLSARDPDQIHVSHHKSFSYWRYILKGYAEGGHWRHALRYIQGRKEVELDAAISLLRSAQRAPVGDLSPDFFLCLPKIVWTHTSLLRLLILIAEGHGYLKELHTAIGKHKENQLVVQYEVLVFFLMYGRLVPDKIIFTDEYVIHRLLMSPAPCRESLRITVGWTRSSEEKLHREYEGNMKAFIQAYYKVHSSCILKKSCNNRQENFILQVIPPNAARLKGDDTLLSVLHGGDVVVAYKPPGIETYGYARSVSRQLHVKRMHYLPYLINPSSCGLILLLASTIPTKVVHLEMKVLARVFPITPSSLPLLSTEFFKDYAMGVISGPSADGEVGIKATCYSDLDGLLAGSFYRLKESMAAEGWGIAVQENMASCTGGDKDNEFVFISDVSVSISHMGFNKEPMHFSMPIPHVYMTQLLPEGNYSSIDTFE